MAALLGQEEGIGSLRSRAMGIATLFLESKLQFMVINKVS